jgi:hypothetical protein
MKIDFKLVLITAVAVTCVGIGLFWQISGDPVEESSSLKYSGLNREKKAPTARELWRAKRVQRISESRDNSLRNKPTMLDLEDEELRELTDLAKKLLASLQAALDADDFDQIQSIVAMIERSPKGVLSKTADGIPGFMRKKLIEAIGWFGAKGIPEIVDFLGDENPEIAEAAMAQFELALEDVTLGDRARAEIVTMASKALHDSDALERIFMEISNMRNSVAAQTLVDVCTYGTEEAKALMPDTIEFVTGEDNIETIDDIQKWLDENPDGEDDEDLYGPVELD